MALVDDHQIEEVGRVLAIETRALLVARERLVDGEVHLPALVCGAAFDLPPGIPERREHAVLRLVDEDVAVCEVEDTRSPGLAGGIPARVPELPTDLEGDRGLAGAGGHGQKL